MVTVICGIKNIHSLVPKLLVLLHLESHKFSGRGGSIGAAECSWLDVNKIKHWKRSAIRSYVSDKQSIVYTSACIESSITEQYHSDKKLNGNYSNSTWNEYNDAFDQQ